MSPGLISESAVKTLESRPLECGAENVPAPPPTGRRKAVLLQGPVGPFFSVLQKRLDEAGWETVRIVFNWGDSVFCGSGRNVRYKGQPENWPVWFSYFSGGG